jgi:3-methyladenine DNA glycosylase AlkD
MGAGCIAGPAWRGKRIPDSRIHRWARSKDRWWRRAALVATVPLNKKSFGGTGDVPRTLADCGLLAADRDDMVVKALSWALRELIRHDAKSVRRCLSTHKDVLAARVLREVDNKLTTGRKSRGQGRGVPERA